MLRRGPARAVKLTHVETARRVTADAIDATLARRQRGDVRLNQEEARRGMQAAAAAVLSRASTSADAMLPEARPATAWWLRMWLLKWVQRTSWPTGRTAVDPAGRRAGQVGCRSDHLVAEATEAATGLRWMVPWAPGTGGLRAWKDGAWRATSLLANIQIAWRAWVRLGGPNAIISEAGKRRDFELTERAARMADGLRARLRTVPEALEVMANVRRRLSRCATVMRRRLYNLEVAGGFRADGRKRWAIDQVIEWRGKNAATRQGLVRWLGFNLATGRDWDDSWIHRAWMTPDLRQVGLIRKPKRAVARADSENGGSDTRGDGQEIRDEPDVAAGSKRARVVWQRGLGAIPTRARGDG